MKAVVLSAGFGTRLRPLTDDLPKVLLPVGGRPLVAHVIRHLAAHGFGEIVVNLHYRADLVRAALQDGAALGARITYFEEPELLGTAGTLAAVRPLLSEGEPFLVHYGDVLEAHDLTAMLAFHRERRALLTLLVHARAGSNSVVVLDDEQRIVDYRERPPDDDPARARSSWVNSGVCVCDPGVLDHVPPPPCDLARDVLPALAGRDDVYAHPLDGFRVVVDSPERYCQAQQAVRDGLLPDASR